MTRWWTNLFDKVWDHILVEEPATKGGAELQGPDHMLRAVEEARREWVTARMYFDSVTDPDLVDHAIFAIQAAERKYMYLLRQAKAQGLAEIAAPLEEKGRLEEKGQPEAPPAGAGV